MDRSNAFQKIKYITGSAEQINQMPSLPGLRPFAEEVQELLGRVSDILMKDPATRVFPDVVTFGFFIRRASLRQLEKRFLKEDEKQMRLGRGVAFHIAPSNVPVNFAYSLVAGLLAGNANVVRVPGKSFAQVDLIADAFRKAFSEDAALKDYVSLIRYERDREVTDALSGLSDVRIIWGGDTTISEIRRSPLPPRGIEITFADRYSLAVIDADQYMEMGDSCRIAQDFYNDTYLTDQNACTSPRIVIWLGKRREEAKKRFWEALHELVSEKYVYQDIQGMNKLTSACRVASAMDGVTVLPHEDNLLIRVRVSKLLPELMEYRDNSGYFYEYDAEDVMELFDICNDSKCQTIGILGDREVLRPILERGCKGVDRIVAVGHSMDFDLIWDGIDLISYMSRVVSL